MREKEIGKRRGGVSADERWSPEGAPTFLFDGGGAPTFLFSGGDDLHAKSNTTATRFDMQEREDERERSMERRGGPTADGTGSPERVPLATLL